MIAFFKRHWVLLAVIVQLSVPVYMVWNYYQVVNRGEKIRLEVNPVDPVDLFCGRYVSLHVPELGKAVPLDESLKPGDRAYVYFETPPGERYAKMTAIGTEPRPGAMRIELEYVSGSGGRASFETNLTRFYLDERFAPEVERMVRRSTNTNLPPASIEVAIKGGTAIITQLYIGDKTAEEACLEARNK